LIVGSALKDSHQFREGSNILTGLTTPWNTNCIWHLRSLAKTGFLVVSDGIAGDTGSAIEEVVVIALQQLIASQSSNKARHKCKLVKIDGITWETGFGSSAERLKIHAKKMQSKVQRAESQLAVLGIPPGSVEHISVVPK
jgi:hypothetical protein